MDAERIRKMQEGRARSTTKVQSNPILAYDKNPTRSRAIKAMCTQCMGCTRERIEPGFARLIRECAAPSCPLYQFRPYQKKVKENFEVSDHRRNEIDATE